MIENDTLKRKWGNLRDTWREWKACCRNGTYSLRQTPRAGMKKGLSLQVMEGLYLALFAPIEGALQKGTARGPRAWVGGSPAKAKTYKSYFILPERVGEAPRV